MYLYSNNNLKDKISGEHDLAEIIGQIIPLITKHFEPFDGSRASLASGAYSAGFNKVIQAFYTEAHELSDARVIVSGDHSIWLKVDIRRQSTGGEHWNYYKTDTYIGTIDNFGFGANTEAFNFEFKAADYIESCKKILATDLDQILAAREKIEAAEKLLAEARGSIHYTFKDFLK